MNKPGIHRVAAGTQAARKHIAASGKITSPQPHAVDPEIRAWNARIDAERAAKKHAKKRVVCTTERPRIPCYLGNAPCAAV